jgi:tRNA-2-methylthio-N6-dimethylallyladenosine synthase
MPLQSGSDRVLKAMRRSYRAQRFLGILDRVRQQIPNAAISTDIIVGFPGETEEDFQATLDVVAQARFAQAFTFQYSPRPGTPAATLADQIPKAVVQERYNRLIELQEEISWQENRKLEGAVVELLVTESEGRKDGATARLSGRAADNRLVHFAVPTGQPAPRPGDFVTIRISYGAPHHLVADLPAATAGSVAEVGVPQTLVYSVRRSPAGDAWDQRQIDACGPTPSADGPGAGPVLLGVPSLRSRP